MAIVTKLAFVPAKGSLKKLIENEPLLLMKVGAKSNPSWQLQTPRGERFIAYVEYQDVIFKFECFGIFFQEGNETANPQGRDADAITMYSIEFLFRAEWQEPSTSEVPSPYRTIARRVAGPLERINAAASSACVSLIGITWISEPDAATRHALTVDVDGDNPTELTYSQDNGAIEALTAHCNVVNAISIDAWEDLISTWTSEASGNAGAAL
jgi:hypothetical protein